MPTPLHAVPNIPPESPSQRAMRLRQEADAAASAIVGSLIAEMWDFLPRLEESQQFLNVPAGIRNELEHVNRELRMRLDIIAAIGARA